MIRLFIIVLFLAFIAIFSLSNLNEITIWFATFGMPVKVGPLIALLSLPSLCLGFLLGWVGELRQIRRARKAEAHARQFQKQILELHKRVDQLNISSSLPQESETVSLPHSSSEK